MKRNLYAVSAVSEAPATAPLLMKGDMCECLRKASAIGYDAIEYHTRETADIDYEAVKRTMKETGCRISMIVTGRLYTEGGYSLMSEDPENEQTAVEGMLKYIEMAKKLNANVVLGWAKGRIPSPDKRDECMVRLTKNFKILDEAARNAGLDIVVEVVNHYETDIFYTSKSLVDYLDANDFTNLKAHLDTYHMNLEETDFPAAIRYAGDRLGYVHFADNSRSYPGSGVIDFDGILGAMKEIGYNGYYSVECLPGDNAEETARRALEHLKKVEERV